MCRSNAPPAAPRFAFRTSPLLGARATNVYAAFCDSLHLPGGVAECGVFTGETSAELVRYLEAKGSDKTLYMFDSFGGLPPIITDEERSRAFGDALHEGNFASSEEAVLARVQGLSRYEIRAGLFSETLASFDRPLCFIHADADLYSSTTEVIAFAERCLVPGGVVVFDDYRNREFPGVTLAVDRHLDPARFEIARRPRSIQCIARKRI